MSETSIKVLVIPPVLERNTDLMLKTLGAKCGPKFSFHTVKPIPRDIDGRVDYEMVTQQCRKIIIEQNISALYANKHTASLVLAALCEEFSHLRGPSVESVFLCNHKYYTSTVVDTRKDKPLTFCFSRTVSGLVPRDISKMSSDGIHCELHEKVRKEKFPCLVHEVGGDVYDSAYMLLQKTSRPSLIRSCLGSGHSVYYYKNRDQLIRVLERCQKDVPHIIEIQRWVLETFVDTKKYPLATKPVILIHPYLDRYCAIAGRTWVNVGIEACVYNGEIIPWAVLDVVTLPHGEKEAVQSFPGCQMPTRLSQEHQDKLWTEFKADIQNLMKYGFNNSFIHAEYVVFENGYVHLITMNARPDAESTNIYTRALHNGNNVEAALQLAIGIRPAQPTPKPGFVLDYCMVVPQSGKADSLLRFDKALVHPDVTLRYLPTQEISIEPAKDFAVVGYITVAGKNFNDCLEKVKRIRTEILKIPELVPLTC